MKKAFVGMGLLAALLTTVAFADDKKDDKKEDAADPTGSYSYTANFTVSLTSPQKQTVTDTDEGTLTVTSSKKSGFVLTFTAKGETCQITAARSGTHGLKFPAGQTCSQQDSASKSDFTITLTSGTGTIHNDSLAMNLAWKLTGAMAGVSVTGRATETVQAEQK